MAAVNGCRRACPLALWAWPSAVLAVRRSGGSHEWMPPIRRPGRPRSAQMKGPKMSRLTFWPNRVTLSLTSASRPWLTTTPDNIKSWPLGVVPWSASFEGSYPDGGQLAPVRRRFLSAPRPTAAAIGSPSRAAPRGRGRAGDGVGLRGQRGKPSGGCFGSCRQPLDLMRYRNHVGGQRPHVGGS